MALYVSGLKIPKHQKGGYNIIHFKIPRGVYPERSRRTRNDKYVSKPNKIILLAIALLLLTTVSSYAQEPPRYALRRVYGEKPGPRTVIITLTHISWNDINSSEMPNLHRLMQQSAVGLMPVASSADRDPSPTWVTLGAGTAAVGGLQVGKVEKIGRGFRQVDVVGLGAANYAAKTGARPGFLGTKIMSVGLSTAVIGTLQSDTPAITIIMDQNGFVDTCNYKMTSSPSKECRHKMNSIFQSTLAHHDVILLDLKISSLPLRVPIYFTLNEADTIIADVVGALQHYQAILWILCPVSPIYYIEGLEPSCLNSARVRIDPDHRTLGPIIMHEFGVKQKSGLLASGSTRWPGLITASDFAPSLLKWWQAPMGGERIAGRPVKVVTTKNALAKINRMDTMITDRYRLRVKAAVIYAIFGALIALLSLRLIKMKQHWAKQVGTLALVLVFYPIGLAVTALLSPGHDVLYILIAFLSAGVIAQVGIGFSRFNLALGITLSMFLGAVVIVVDVLSGSPLMRFSALEMGVMKGSRFYGIGNEYMGALVGMAMIGLGAMLEILTPPPLPPPRTQGGGEIMRASAVDPSATLGTGLPKQNYGRSKPPSAEFTLSVVEGLRAGLPNMLAKLSWILGVFLVLVIGAPFWGANWGGAFTAGVGLVALWLLCLQQVAWRHLLVGGVLLLLSALMPAGLDLLQPAPDRSHIGVSFSLLLAGQQDHLTDAIARKEQIAINVIKSAPWSLLGAALCAVVFWFHLRRGAAARCVLSHQPYLFAGIAAALIAGAVAMVVNDSGPAAGFGAILAALGAVVFLSSRVAELKT